MCYTWQIFTFTEEEGRLKSHRVLHKKKRICTLMGDKQQAKTTNFKGYLEYLFFPDYSSPVMVHTHINALLIYPPPRHPGETSSWFSSLFSSGLSCSPSTFVLHLSRDHVIQLWDCWAGKMAPRGGNKMGHRCLPGFAFKVKGRRKS